MDVKHYERDWLTSDEGLLSCAEFFIRTEYKAKYYTIGFSIKNRNQCGVFLMIDRDGKKASIKQFRAHEKYLEDLISTLDQIHDVLIKSVGRGYDTKKWSVDHVDMFSLTTITMESVTGSAHRMLFQIGTKTAFFNYDTQTMIDLVLTLSDMVKNQHRKMKGLIVHEETK
ncbi:hypothetical protein [Vibrio phage VP4B]|uniref:Uncharacterized protein n=1 Tax=Vibrio phage VP4B TaxID=1262540 RepID=V9M0Q4_9CAUD|nr:hypothetical protein FDJ61_gp134 [Vibrio phage VP4B]AGB07248.1 hypothetical protein [Vibrio phage VP4B]